MLYLILLLLSYSVFVFVAENLNPFLLTELPFKRRRWRLGRQSAIIVFVIGAGCLFGWQKLGIDQFAAIFMFIGGSLLLLIPCILRYKRRDVWG